MSYLFIEYPRCTTCKKAKRWLIENNVDFKGRHIVEENPNIEELKKWIVESGLPIKKFFNTSGVKYKELNLKDKLPNLTEDEQMNLLASDGMLVKRPIIVGNNKVLVGFKEEDWEKLK